MFLKNADDRVTLSFKLLENIYKLNNNEKLYINEDTDGYDTQFELPKQNFGKGTLIVQFTDYENKVHEPMVYTNFLGANSSVNANTVINLFEEGDYEVSLDYEIKYDKTKVMGLSLFPQISHYKLKCKFKVRNSNCMVYPFDTSTGSELMNSAHTANGFYVDLAKSKYLDVSIKKEIVTQGTEGLVEDTRFNKFIKSDSSFTDEGVYTITASNKYTGLSTTKKIYVGNDPTLISFMYSGLSLSEFKDLIAKGATIQEDGTLIMPNNEPFNKENLSEDELEEAPINPIVIGVVTAFVLVTGGYILILLKKK